MSGTLKLDMIERRCPACGTILPSDLPPDLCPKCLLQAGLGTRTVDPAATIPCPSDSRRSLKGLPLPGDEFGHFKITRLLGQGGMGVVYEAEDLESCRRVALKILQGSLDTVEARTRFLREGQLAASINHPHSVYVFGVAEIAGTPVIIMELMVGGTLKDRVQREGPLSAAAAVEAILQVIAGLEAAAGAGLLHRDVKPSNCFVDSEGTIKIGDYGLSIDTKVRAELDSLAAGGLSGTPAFCSPEQLRGDALTVRSDIYAVGVTLYYLLTGRTPFEGQDLAHLLPLVLESQPESPAHWRPGIPAGLCRVVLRCLEKGAGERFGDYAALRQALLPHAAMELIPTTFGTRFIAGCMDVMPMTSVAFIASGWQQKQDWQATAVFYAIIASYFTLLEGLAGASLGKAIFGLRVVCTDGRRPGLLRALWRSLIFIGVVIFGTDFTTIVVFGGVPNGLVSLAILFGMMSLAFSTARKRNGFAGVHDWLSQTRVIAKLAGQTRPRLFTTPAAAPVLAGAAQVGPYHVLATLAQSAGETFLLGYDSRLLRQVWIRQLPTGAPEAEPALRNIGRPARLRWLNGRRSATEAWDAYEASAGRPFLEVVTARQDWASVRFWLFDLAKELPMAARDGSGPAALGLEQIWITESGHAKLLDFAAPGTSFNARQNVPPLPPGEFLHLAAVAALEGRLPHPGEARNNAPMVPVALHGRDLVMSLRENNADSDAAARLEPLLGKNATISRARRLGLLACAMWFPLILTAFIMVIDPGHKLGLMRQTHGPLILAYAYGLTQVIAPGLLAALLFRGGAILHAFRVAIVRRDGRPASRLRVFWRSFVAFLPFLVLPAVAWVLGQHARLEWIMYLLLVLLAVLALFSALLPGRSLPDRLAGTWLVPR